MSDTTIDYPATPAGYAALKAAEPGLTQVVYAARLGVSTRTLRNWKTDDSPAVVDQDAPVETVEPADADTLDRGGELAVYDPNARSYLIPTTINGLALTFRADQTTLDAAQMHILAPLGIAANWDPHQVRSFLLQCLSRGLDPWQKMAYLLKIDGKYVFHVSISGLLTQAEETGQYLGLTKPQWCGQDMEWRDTWLDKSTPPAAARIGVLRAGFDAPVWGIATYDEYAVHKDEWITDEGGRDRKTGNRVPVANWRPAALGGKPNVMLIKCAKAAALRDAFPTKFGGFYVAEETERMRYEADEAAGRDTPEVRDRRRAAYDDAMAAAATAEPAPAFDGHSDAEARALLLAELDEQAAVFGKTRSAVVARWVNARGGVPVEDWPVHRLVAAVRELRRYVVEELRRLGRNDEAGQYERAPTVGTVEDLFGRSPATIDGQVAA